jgi:hypothetical protein
MPSPDSLNIYFKFLLNRPMRGLPTSMQTRLLAFLHETERSIRAGKPEPAPSATWETTRSVNYALGLAKLTLAAKTGTGPATPQGSVLLQSFKLADSTVCLKATLSWGGAEMDVTHPIFSKPTLNWEAEASRLADAWICGPAEQAAEIRHEESILLAAG